MDGGCRKYAQKLPNILKFQVYTGFAGLRAPYGPQVAALKKKIEKRRFWNDLTESRDMFSQNFGEH